MQNRHGLGRLDLLFKSSILKNECLDFRLWLTFFFQMHEMLKIMSFGLLGQNMQDKALSGLLRLWGLHCFTKGKVYWIFDLP